MRTSTETGPTPPTPRGRALSLSLALTFCLFTLPQWVDAVGAVQDGDTRAVVAGTAVLYALVCVAAVPLAGGARYPVRAAVCLVALALGGALVVRLGPDASWVALFALAVSAVLLPVRSVALLTVPAAAAPLLWALVRGDAGGQFSNLVLLVSSTAAVALLRVALDANAELRAARGEIAVLATARERERVARDLHDILGHSLTAITLKAGVARRVLETSGDTGRAAGEIADLEALARAALADVRATVSGYRTVTLAGELAAGASALAAAGIAADLPGAVDDVDPALRGVFGYVVREAVTNAVRHSAAGTVRVRLGPRSVEVEDDGRAETGVRPGNGLRGLAERMREAGGTLEVRPRGGGGLLVRAHVPGTGEKR
ncbi:sensor histidine kinase [Actinorugispora endophytica]|uniref:sensor histidine kinase n=1 Tax=Actinorugispora endophytica TaxID=1605990 RepID=UPI001AADEFB3|nr:histidine kinase [Actinorugispora endophytica]